MSDKRRRIELSIGVAYDSEMEEVKRLIEEGLDQKKILKPPPSKVLMQNFGESSVDFRVLFWIENFEFWINVRGEIMTAIFESIAQDGIEIPFLKRDLYLKTAPASWKESIIPSAESLEIESKTIKKNPLNDNIQRIN
ncbi:MAG: potassium efflux system protein [Algoriphagus sp.]